MHADKDLICKPVSKFGRFYNNPSEYTQKYIEFLVCTGKALTKEIIVFSTSLFKVKLNNTNLTSNWHEPSKVTSNSVEPIVTWIGHSTFLIQIGNINILTDPIFVSPSIFFPRILKPGLQLEELPKIDYVMISHNHWDHLSKVCIEGLKKQFPEIKFLLPKGDGYWFSKWGIDNFCEFEWWQTLNIDNLKFTFLPAHHWSQRSTFDQNRSLWGSWMVEGASTIYFAGDTAYSYHFELIGKRFTNIDIALMPVGPCEPAKWMCKSHINAEDACKGFLELGAKKFIPMHWGTFYFGTDNFDTPIIRLQNWWKLNKGNLNDKVLHILKFGQSLNN